MTTSQSIQFLSFLWTGQGERDGWGWTRLHRSFQISSYHLPENFVRDSGKKTWTLEMGNWFWRKSPISFGTSDGGALQCVMAKRFPYEKFCLNYRPNGAQGLQSFKMDCNPTLYWVKRTLLFTNVTDIFYLDRFFRLFNEWYCWHVN